MYGFIGFTCFILLIIIVTYDHAHRKDKKDRKYREEHETISRLNEQIDTKRNELENLELQVRNQSFDSSVSLTHIESKALDKYSESNIQIPTDIIEELTHKRFTDETDIINYIENQRLYWKLENSKKLFKRKDVKS